MGRLRDHILVLTLWNYSEVTLDYQGVAGKNLGNFFICFPPIIPPFTWAWIFGITTAQEDLVGQLLFSQGSLIILDQLKFHVGQPIFSFIGPYLTSEVLSMWLNLSGGPKTLNYLAVDLAVWDLQ